MAQTVLLIDDDDQLRALLQVYLEGWGFTVLPADSGQAGVELLAAKAPDLVLTDMRMPGLSGMEVLEKVKSSQPGTPVVIMTAHGSVRDAVTVMHQGAFDYVLKPINDKELKMVLDRALEMQRLRKENKFLRDTLKQPNQNFVAESDLMKKVRDLLLLVAGTDSTVLLTGETGSGKEVAARFIHLNSSRSTKPFVAFNCAALNTNLLESELFGHEKGAFTGAVSGRKGRFEQADGGTILLDEIGEISLEFQAKLLRVLELREFERVGGNTPIKVDVRILASTNRDLASEVAARRFRQDLLYRLNIFPVHLPPLRERRDDILPLARLFLARYANEYGLPIESLPPSAEEKLLAHGWPGNIRELQHAIERAVVLSRGRELDLALFGLTPAAQESASSTAADLPLQAAMDQAAAKHIRSALELANGRRQKAAEMLGIDRVTLYRMIRKHGLESPKNEG